MARLGVIADPHGNLTAVRAVLAELERAGVDGVVCAGDLVGYNAEPDEVVACLTREAVCVAGNHDRIALGWLDDRRAWRGARHALARTRDVLSRSTRDRLAELPIQRGLADGIVLFHGSVDDVAHRTSRHADVLANQAALATQGVMPSLAIFGHTHRPSLQRIVEGREGPRVVDLPAHGRVALPMQGSIYLNPGSVDGARRGAGIASFAIVDTVARTVTFGSVAYDHEASERRARRAGYRMPRLVRARSAFTDVARRAGRKMRTWVPASSNGG
jgi:predicted phosphodiesterase